MVFFCHVWLTVKYCSLGLKINDQVESSGNQVTVQFMSGVHHTGQGFYMSYSTTEHSGTQTLSRPLSAHHQLQSAAPFIQFKGPELHFCFGPGARWVASVIACDCVSHSCFLSVPLFFFFCGSEVIILSWKDSLICNIWVCVKVGSSSQFLHFSYIIFMFYHRNVISWSVFSLWCWRDIHSWYQIFFCPVCDINNSWCFLLEMLWPLLPHLKLLRYVNKFRDEFKNKNTSFLCITTQSKNLQLLPVKKERRKTRFSFLLHNVQNTIITSHFW